MEEGIIRKNREIWEIDSGRTNHIQTVSTGGWEDVGVGEFPLLSIKYIGKVMQLNNTRKALISINLHVELCWLMVFDCFSRVYNVFCLNFKSF